MKKQGVSVIIPTIRTNRLAFESIQSVIISLNNFKNKKKELILCADRKLQKADMLLLFAKKYPFIKVIAGKRKTWSAYARNLGINKAKYAVLLFTDDDCLVPKNWVKTLSNDVIKKGICAGVLKAKDSKNLISKLEERIDFHRIQSRDHTGNIKWLSFPNLGIRKDLLPPTPFCLNKNNTVEDMSLACRLRLNGHEISLNNKIIVKVEYPKNIKDVISRKIKHARGMAFLHRRLTSAMKEKLKIETNIQTTLRWLNCSFKENLKIGEKILFLLINMTYCVVLFYFDKVFSKVRHLSNREVYKKAKKGYYQR